MYAKGKGSTVPSDAQAREKLALYVYEYLLHVGAQKSAQTFLSEIRWEKNITLGEPPGFLHSWWCVFWDLYCAAPERRDTCDHSSEAKAFHDYGFVNSGYAVNGIAHNAPAPSPLGQMPPQDGMPGGPMPPGFFPPPPASQPSPHPPSAPHNQMMPQNQPFMSPRYGSPRGPVRMPNQGEFDPPGSVGGGQMPIPNSMDVRPGRFHDVHSPGLADGMMGHPGMGAMQRMSHPGRMPGPPMNPNYGMRGPPPNSMGPGPGGPGGMPPMSMPGGQGNRPWPPTSSTINYTSASPGNYNGPPQSGPPGTPIMSSPHGSTGPYSPASHRLPTPRRDSNSGDGMYGMMKPNMGHGMPGFGPMGPEGGMGPMGPGDMPPVMNGDGMDGMKSSPANGPGTPRDDMPPNGGPGSEMGGYNPYQDNVPQPPVNDQNESAAILKIKESMQEEAKRFEKTEGPPDHSDYFMQ
ncbi:single-stranded DNA-binding protein 3-like isoform X4 [Lineus longissimus]|uniref:single-stranded DNA-binding protein 3-like isoform X4 n=1 Tax=Lineus longissimus TaxID=88925 RepID=UPI00315CA585